MLYLFKRTISSLRNLFATEAYQVAYQKANIILHDFSLKNPYIPVRILFDVHLPYLLEMNGSSCRSIKAESPVKPVVPCSPMLLLLRNVCSGMSLLNFDQCDLP